LAQDGLVSMSDVAEYLKKAGRAVHLGSLSPRSKEVLAAATSAPGLAHICAGTGPHLRRDSVHWVFGVQAKQTQLVQKLESDFTARALNHAARRRARTRPRTCTHARAQMHAASRRPPPRGCDCVGARGGACIALSGG
jgi:hypothetical protein